eukprot:9192499-Ditylum_brightwellii.AAC.1
MAVEEIFQSATLLILFHKMGREDMAGEAFFQPATYSIGAKGTKRGRREGENVLLVIKNHKVNHV